MNSSLKDQAFPDENNYGISKRDYFAAKAMQSFTNEVGWKSDQEWFDSMAEGAYRMADAMLKAREQ